jgi:SAM-dependent methyltransferase
MSDRSCRSCGAALHRRVVDLGSTPLANSYLSAEQVEAGRERSYPLEARVCDACLLVQVDEVVPPEEIFSDYAYFSSISDSWLDHVRRYAHAVSETLGLGPESLVVEVASNDGYLLRNFVDAGIPVLGIEPAANVAEVAVAGGVPTEVRFFGAQLAEELVARGISADLVVADNVLAHVPDLDDFIRGLRLLLGRAGVLTIEVPHLLRMIERVEFDTIYHEHFSYFSLLAARSALEARGLRVFDVEELPTHGGSLRIWAARDDASRSPSERVEAVLAAERAAGLDRPETYETFTEKVDEVRAGLRSFLDDARKEGKAVVAYGAAAKGNTLLNSVGATVDDIQYVADRSPHKQGLFLPGSHLPIREPDAVRRDKPDYLLLLAWNLRDEIMEQMSFVRDWGCRFVARSPELRVFE